MPCPRYIRKRRGKIIRLQLQENGLGAQTLIANAERRLSKKQKAVLKAEDRDV